MEPKALVPGNNTPFKDKPIEVEKTERALAELSLNKGSFDPYGVNVVLDTVAPLQSIGLQLARSKSLQHTPAVSSPLTRKSWVLEDV
jgi:hypothetical protein